MQPRDDMRTYVAQLDSDQIIDLWRFLVATGGLVESCRIMNDGKFAFVAHMARFPRIMPADPDPK